MNMIILTGPSASGKTLIAYHLQKKYGIKKAITSTTREKRVNEVNGVDYYFVDKNCFLKMIYLHLAFLVLQPIHLNLF